MSSKNKTGFERSDSDSNQKNEQNSFSSSQSFSLPVFSDSENTRPSSEEVPQNQSERKPNTSSILTAAGIGQNKHPKVTTESIKRKPTSKPATPRPKVSTANSKNSTNNPPRVFIRDHSADFKSTSIFGLLIQLFRLDVYGSNKMTRRARYALERSTILFSVIALFDFMMWFILFNLIFNRGALSFSVINPIALLLAGCMALVSMIFETSLFTADFTLFSRNAIRENPLQTLGLFTTIGIRVLLILFAALITAEPFHLLMFNGPIKEISRVEQGIEKSVAIIDEIKENKVTLVKSICNDDQEKELLGDELKKLEAEYKELKDMIDAIKDGRATIYIETRENEIRQIIKWLKTEDCRNKWIKRGNSAEDATNICLRAVSKRNKELQKLREDYKAATLKIADKETDLKQLEKKLEKLTDKKSKLAKAYQACESEVNLMDEWYTTGLKGYSRKIISTSSDAEVFTLSSCYDAKESLNQCADLEDQSADFLDIKFKERKAQLRDEGLETHILEARFKALSAVFERKKQYCTDWCFEYQEPHFFDQVRVLDQYVYGTSVQWPDRNYSLTDCHYMINVLRIPPPALGRCASFSNEGDVSNQDSESNNMINAVTIQNTTRPNGLAYNAGSDSPDTLRCSVRLKPAYEGSQFELRWVVNGSPRNSLGLFSHTDPTLKSTAELILSDDVYAGDTIACKATPLGSNGAFAQSKVSDTIEVTSGPTRTAVKTISSDTNKRLVLYWLVTLIGVFIPLISLIYKLSAPEDLKKYYSSKYQNDPTSSAEGIRAALKAKKRRPVKKSSRKESTMVSYNTSEERTTISADLSAGGNVSDVRRVPSEIQPATPMRSRSDDTPSPHIFDDNETYPRQ